MRLPGHRLYKVGPVDLDGLAAKWRTRNEHLDQGPGLHILVLTLRCNHKCLYCQSSAAGEGAKKTDMPLKTALKSVDFAFSSPNPAITIEFQGGEPLLNWAVLKAVTKYARKKAAASKKQLKLALVSNFTLMTEEKAKFLLENEVSLCTSLDGPADLHDRHRKGPDGSPSHAAAMRAFGLLTKAGVFCNILCVITADSAEYLSQPQQELYLLNPS